MKKGYLFIVLTAFLYSTQEISGRVLAARGKMDPFQVTFIIFFIGAVLLAPLAFRDIKEKQLKLVGNDFAYFGICGALCVPISMSLLQFAVTYTKASTSAVLFCTNAVFTVPFAYFLLKEKVSKTTLISMGISLIGVVIIFNPSKVLSGMTGGRDLIGIAYALGAAVSWSLFTVMSKKRIHKYGGYVFNFFAFCSGVVILTVVLLATNRPILSGINTANIMILVYMGVFIKALGYIFYLGAIKETSAVTASMVFLIKPALATILSIVLLSEKVELNVIAGIACIVIGSYINFSTGRKTEQQKIQTLAE